MRRFISVPRSAAIIISWLPVLPVLRGRCGAQLWYDQLLALVLLAVPVAIRVWSHFRAGYD
jgi:hypothetical protein